MVRFEHLRTDVLGIMKRIYASLEMPSGESARKVQKHSWENIAERRDSIVKLLFGARRGCISEHP